MRWLSYAVVVTAVVMVAGCGGGGGGGASSEEPEAVKRIKDPEGIWCDANTAKHGRCPRNRYFGMTVKQVNATKKKAELETKKRRTAGWNQLGPGLWWKWGESPSKCPYRACWTMEVASTQCKALTATIERRESRDGPSLGETRGSVANLDSHGDGIVLLGAPNGRWARFKALECSTGKGHGSTYGDPTSSDVQFIVTGGANGVDITYGNDTSNHQGPSNLPAQMTMPLRSDALYYALTAQLQGSGRITCKLQIGDVVAVGHASGGYNICRAQLNSDPYTGGWSK